MNWNTFRDEVCAWSTANFGGQTTLRPWLGFIEEIGELVDATNSRMLYDAVGDAMVYLGDFTGRRGIDLAAIVVNPLNMPSGIAPCARKAQYESALRLIGIASHSVLKIEQQIRLNENHQAQLIAALQELVLWLRGQMSDSSLEGLDSVVTMTWDKVKQRNWKANPVDGSV